MRIKIPLINTEEANLSFSWKIIEGAFSTIPCTCGSFGLESTHFFFFSLISFSLI